jgi:hypothetical protein
MSRKFLVRFLYIDTLGLSPMSMMRSNMQVEKSLRTFDPITDNRKQRNYGLLLSRALTFLNMLR